MKFYACKCKNTENIKQVIHFILTIRIYESFLLLFIHLNPSVSISTWTSPWFLVSFFLHKTHFCVESFFTHKISFLFISIFLLYFLWFYTITMHISKNDNEIWGGLYLWFLPNINSFLLSFFWYTKKYQKFWKKCITFVAKCCVRKLNSENFTFFCVRDFWKELLGASEIGKFAIIYFWKKYFSINFMQTFEWIELWKGWGKFLLWERCAVHWGLWIINQKYSHLLWEFSGDFIVFYGDFCITLWNFIENFFTSFLFSLKISQKVIKNSIKFS